MRKIGSCSRKYSVSALRRTKGRSRRVAVTLHNKRVCPQGGCDSLCSVLPEGTVGVLLPIAVSCPFSMKLFRMNYSVLMVLITQLGKWNGDGAIVSRTAWACLVFAVLCHGQHCCGTGWWQDKPCLEGTRVLLPGAWSISPCLFVKAVRRRAVVVAGFLLQGLFLFLQPVAECFWHTGCFVLRNAGRRLCSGPCRKRTEFWCVRVWLLHVSAGSSAAVS